MSTDQPLIVTLACPACDVRWRGVEGDPCWLCGRGCSPEATTFVPTCNATWETETHPPYEAIGRGDVA